MMIGQEMVKTRASTAQAALDRAHRGEPVLRRGKRSDAGRDAGARRRARGLPPREGASEHSGARHGASGPCGADRPAVGGEKQLLQSAAVIGKDVPFSLLTAIAAEPEEVVRGRLSHLQAAEFMSRNPWTARDELRDTTPWRRAAEKSPAGLRRRNAAVIPAWTSSCPRS